MSPKVTLFFYFVKKIFDMRKWPILLIVSFFALNSFSQVAEMNWELDYKLYMKLANDSNYTYDIREAFHVTNTKESFTSDFVFYPVKPGKEYAGEVSLMQNGIDNYSTLWSALHAKLGGGWIHFSNCIAYSIETQSLDFMAPLMKRPDTDWKPKPMTDSYKRTKKWDYYVPVSQDDAHKEYKTRLKSGSVGDLESLPKSYVDLFLNTSQKEYDKLSEEGKKDVVAKIDLVKLLLGANYLGETQINYISNAILESVLSYSSNMLPSVIIFDEYDAAAAMSLNENGYKIESIVYKASANLNESESLGRKLEIEQIVRKINEYNRMSFKKRLGNYYK